MTRTTSLTDEDIKSLEKELSEKTSHLSEAQKQFTSHLITRAKAGSQAAPEADKALWLWTYRY